MTTSIVVTDTCSRAALNNIQLLQLKALLLSTSIRRCYELRKKCYTATSYEHVFFVKKLEIRARKAPGPNSLTYPQFISHRKIQYRSILFTVIPASLRFITILRYCFICGRKYERCRNFYSALSFNTL